LLSKPTTDDDIETDEKSNYPRSGFGFKTSFFKSLEQSTKTGLGPRVHGPRFMQHKTIVVNLMYGFKIFIIWPNMF
jgi:hypothetical protein